MIDQADLRIVKLMIEKIDRLIEIVNKHSKEEIENNYVVGDSLQFEFEKLYEDSTRLSSEFRMNNNWLHIDDLRSIRNRVAHNYESVSLTILIDTVNNDIPLIKEELEQIINNSYK